MPQPGGLRGHTSYVFPMDNSPRSGAMAHSVGILVRILIVKTYGPAVGNPAYRQNEGS